MFTSEVRCPHGHIDEVQKVSAVWAANVQSLRRKEQYFDYVSETQKDRIAEYTSVTALGGYLTPPLKPSNKEYSFGLFLSWGLVIFLFISGGFFVLAPLRYFDWGPVILSFCGVQVIFIILAEIYIAALVNKRMPSWERRYAIWQQLYYCSRHDIVFDPRTNWAIEAEHFQEHSKE